MTHQEPPKIEFPCENYPIKVLGESAHDYHSFVMDVFETHAPGFDTTTIRINQSSGGRFTAITVFITATGVEQLETLHKTFMASGRVKMVI